MKGCSAKGEFACFSRIEGGFFDNPRGGMNASDVRWGEVFLPWLGGNSSSNFQVTKHERLRFIL